MAAARPRRRERRARSGHRLTERRGDHRDRGPLAPDRRPGTTRSRGWRRRSTRCSARSRTRPGAAPARLGRVARAAHAGDEPAHEHRGARARRGAAAGRARAAAPRRHRATDGDDGADRRARRAGPRRPGAGRPEDVRLDLVTGRGDRADAAQPPRRRVQARPRADDDPRRPPTIERAVSNLLDNAAKWSPPGGEIEVTVRDGDVAVRDHGPASTRRPPLRVRPLLPGAGRARRARLGPRPRDRPPGRRGARRHGHGRARRRRRHADAAEAELESLKLSLRAPRVSMRLCSTSGICRAELLRRRGRNPRRCSATQSASDS